MDKFTKQMQQMIFDVCNKGADPKEYGSHEEDAFVMNGLKHSVWSVNDKFQEDYGHIGEKDGHKRIKN